MSSPIFDQLTANIDALKEAAYKRGHLKARHEMLEAIKDINPAMMSGEVMLGQVIAIIGLIQTPAKAPKPRAKKVAS